MTTNQSSPVTPPVYDSYEVYPCVLLDTSHTPLRETFTFERCDDEETDDLLCAECDEPIDPGDEVESTCCGSVHAGCYASHLQHCGACGDGEGEGLDDEDESHGHQTE